METEQNHSSYDKNIHKEFWNRQNQIRKYSTAVKIIFTFLNYML
jgi:hypothetical protein